MKTAVRHAASPASSSWSIRPAFTVQRKCAACKAEDEQVQAKMAPEGATGARRGHDFSQMSVRAAGGGGLTLGRVDDPAEREADDIASAMVRGDANATPRAGAASGGVQRKGVDGEACPAEDEAAQRPQQQPPKEEEPVQAKAEAGGGGGALPASFSASLGATRAGGSPLPDGLRNTFQTKLGSSLADVRLHADVEAGRLARSIGADAFTSGAHVYFAPGRYAPHTPAGQHLLAHELVHVVQQRGAGGGAPIRRYTLSGFDPAQTAAMNAAVPAAKAKVLACGGKGVTVSDRADILRGLDKANFVYDPELKICGYTHPFTDTIKLGPKSFNYDKCCALESTLAHECGHAFAWMLEGTCRKMECACFGCSC